MGEVGFEVQLNLNGHDENGEDVIALKKSLHHENGDGIHHEHQDDDTEQENTTTNGTASHKHSEHIGEEEKTLENGVHKGEEHHHHEHEHEHEHEEEEEEDEEQHQEHHEVDESYHSNNINTNTNTHHPIIEEQTKNTNEQHQIQFSVTSTESTQDNGEHISDSVVVLENGTDHKHEEEEEEEEVEERETHHNQQQPQHDVNNDENKHTTNTNGHHFHSSSYIDEPRDKTTSENLDSSFVILNTNETKETREGEEEEEEEDEEEATHSKEKGRVETIVAEEGSVNVSAPRLSEDQVLEEALKPFINDSSSTFNNNPIPLKQPTTPPREEPEPPTVSPRAAAQKLKDVGNAHFTGGRFDESIECYSQAIALDPEDSVYYSNRSAAYLSKGLSKEALTDGLKAIQLKPNWSKAYVRAGRAYMIQEKHQEAIDILEEGLRKDPSAPQKEITDLINNCKINLKKKEQPSSSSLGPSPSAGGLGTNLHKCSEEEMKVENEEGDSGEYDDFDEEESVQTKSTLKTNEPQPQNALIQRGGTLFLLLGTLAGIGFTLYRFIVKGK